jgi:hypothetical protein
VSTYIGLGNRSVTAAEDTTGQNPGNWTNDFSASVLGVSVPQFEVYRGVVTNSPAGGSAVIQAGIRELSFTAPGLGGGSEWDPSQPPILLPGQDLYFFWNIAASGTAPVVTLWLRYDLDVLTAARKGLIR